MTSKEVNCFYISMIIAAVVDPDLKSVILLLFFKSINNLCRPLDRWASAQRPNRSGWTRHRRSSASGRTCHRGRDLRIGGFFFAKKGFLKIPTIILIIQFHVNVSGWDSWNFSMRNLSLRSFLRNFIKIAITEKVQKNVLHSGIASDKANIWFSVSRF